MAYREKMHGNDMSRAEISLWMALNLRGIHGFDAHHKIVLKWTIPDFFFQFDTRYKYDALAVYLDGEEVHCDLDRDDSITKQLEAKHIKVLRYRYNPPLSEKRRNEILDEIEKELKLFGWSIQK